MLFTEITALMKTLFEINDVCNDLESFARRRELAEVMDDPLIELEENVPMSSLRETIESLRMLIVQLSYQLGESAGHEKAMGSGEQSDDHNGGNKKHE